MGRHNYNIDVSLRMLLDSNAGNKVSQQYKAMINQMVKMAEEAGHSIDKNLLTSTGKLDFRKDNAIVDWLKNTGLQVKAQINGITGEIKSFQAFMKTFGEGGWVAQSWTKNKQGGFDSGNKTVGTGFASLSDEFKRVYSDLISTEQRAHKVLQQDAQDISGAYANATQRVQELEKELKELENRALTDGDESLPKTIRRLENQRRVAKEDMTIADNIEATKKYKNAVSQLWQEEEKLARIKAQKRSPQEIAVQEQYVNNLHRTVQGLENQNKEITDSVKNSQEFKQALDEHNHTIELTQKHYTKTTSLLTKLKANFKNIFAGVLEAGLSWKIFAAGTSALNKSIDIIKDLDKAVTDLRIATGYSTEQVRDMLVEYNKMAQELGATTTEVAESADTWLKILGHLYSNVYEINSFNCWKSLRAL